MKEHVPYENRKNQSPDFKVEYKIRKDDSFGYIQKPYQGMRSDFMYDGDDPQADGIYMIWPEFLDKSGQVITDQNQNIDDIGQAYMWILSPEIREAVHLERVKVGTKGYFMMGSKKIADAIVIKIHGLHTNKS